MARTRPSPEDIKRELSWVLAGRLAVALDANEYLTNLSLHEIVEREANADWKAARRPAARHERDPVLRGRARGMARGDAAGAGLVTAIECLLQPERPGCRLVASYRDARLPSGRLRPT